MKFMERVACNWLLDNIKALSRAEVASSPGPGDEARAEATNTIISTIIIIMFEHLIDALDFNYLVIVLEVYNRGMVHGPHYCG